MSQKNGILIWRDPADWNNAVQRLLTLLPSDIKTAIERNPIEYFYYYSKWCEERNIRYQNGNELPGCRELLEGIELIYPKIRLFHACRTEDINSYLKNGLRTFDLKRQIQKAKDIFISDKFPNITEEHINTAGREIDNQGRDNRISLYLDDIHLIQQYPEYFVYGSESLRNIASRLPRIKGENCMEFLRTIGSPTIFVCDIPLCFMEKQSIFNLLIDLINFTISYPYKHGDEKPSIDRTFNLSNAIDPSFITSYYHPE